MARFRAKLFAALMLVILALTALGLYLVQRNVATNVERDLRQHFEAELSTLDKVQELRHAALEERCRLLAAKPRIHAALEDNALDLLYPSAKDELQSLMNGEESSGQPAAVSLRARFYRFLNSAGAVLPPKNQKDVGELGAAAEAQLALKQLPTKQQLGYVLEDVDLAGETVDEVMVVPILSSETDEVISALVVGFKPFELVSEGAGEGMRSGIWENGQLHLLSLGKSAQTTLALQIGSVVGASDRVQSSFTVNVDGRPHLLFYKRLNPNSLLPPAYEICLYPLSASIARQHRLRWEIGGAGAFLLLAGFGVSHVVAGRLAAPVEKLAVDSEMNRAQRRRAEAALASTSEELKRSSRYSADASHQLKNPVTVLRAGLEGLLTREDFRPEVYHELSTLLHQTHRLTGVIDDLLLLSRMDAGHLQIQSAPVNLGRLIEEWLDDLSAVPDSLEVTIEKSLPPELYVVGEERYISLIAQNLLENARKYNRPGGRIRVTAVTENDFVRLTIGNTGQPIPLLLQAHLFERFYHGPDGASVSGHGLGLNLALELVRLHGGDLQLLRSSDDWTEFALRLPIARSTSNRAGPVA